ncbi:MAG TPA: TetR/AcrR family transcriptional regulator [Candidatus Blautia gallistercoris]|uniref:TetR/AcrR family transcriptional regulator n=1 Tax=Candidatus Blautia gallistercoris TaxID=2838490 RepID=A0A9D1WHG3_9FIRM|nr:TetR/AcrR family transcriptional regulator [Candidatus Blautia gallistercoris]
MEKTQKTDRRTRYTRQTIKDILLEELKTKPYSKITVTELCKKAEMNRGTFYLHYCDIDDVLDDIFKDFLSDTTSVLDHVLCPYKQNCTYPFCEKIHSASQYQVLFFDDITASRMLERLADSGKEQFITHLMQHSLLTFEQAEAIFYFQMNGCLAINRRMIKQHCDDWTKIQQAIDQFIKAGIENFLIHDQREELL